MLMARRDAFIAALLGLALLLAAARLWAPPGPAAAATVTIDVGDIWFCSPAYGAGVVCETTVTAGDTVTWDFEGAQEPHTTTACGASCSSPVPKDQALWHSGVVAGGSTGQAARFSYTFTQPGTYNYYCQVHALEHRGRIVVLGGATSLGDVDCNGSISSIDAALILQLGAGLIDALGCQQNADTNGDGRVNAVDAALVLQHVAGLFDLS
jgi:hypothetical protein